MKKLAAVIAVAALCTISSSAFAGKRHYAPAGHGQRCAPVCAPAPSCCPARPCGGCNLCIPNPLSIVGGVVSGVGCLISGIGEGLSGIFGGGCY